MKKLGPRAYRALFTKHVWRFLGQVTSSHELRGEHAVSVSGGLDSMSLLWLAKMLHKEGLIGEVRAIFIHHHTREGQNSDKELVQAFCNKEAIPFVCLDIEGLGVTDVNFESKAREMRRKLSTKEVRPNELLWQGHHLDDSYEWTFMQRHRSNSQESSLGIPVRNGRIVRPFLSVTRQQLQKLAKNEGIPFREDPSNFDLKYDRNFVRHKITPVIRKKYPKYLKFYAQSSNLLATSMGVSLFKNGQAESHTFNDGAILLGETFSETQIQDFVHRYSSTHRGKTMDSINRMLRAIENGKKGPFQFSGGVEAYSSFGLLMIYRQKFKNYDEAIASVLSNFSLESLLDLGMYQKSELESVWKNLLNTHDAMLNMPGLILVLEPDSINKSLNTSCYDPLFPEVSAVCKEKGLRFMSITKCLQLWEKKKEKLPKTLRLLPLCNLSHLFPSQ